MPELFVVPKWEADATSGRTADPMHSFWILSPVRREDIFLSTGNRWSDFNQWIPITRIFLKKQFCKWIPIPQNPHTTHCSSALIVYYKWIFNNSFTGMARLQYLLIAAITSRTFQMHDPREKQRQLNEADGDWLWWANRFGLFDYY